MQIEVNNISKEFDKKLPTHIKVLKDININFDEGEMISIIGHTGSGKTTFIEHLNALLLPDSGMIKFKNINVPHKKLFSKKQEIQLVETDIEIVNTKRKIKNIKSVRKEVGVVFQFAEYQLFENTIEKDIIFGPVSMGVPVEKAKQLARKYLEMVGLPESYLDKSPFNLSGGQKRRVALAGILAMEPKFLILDEPTAGLDPVGVESMLQLFSDLNKKENKAVIIVTHDLDNALRWTKRCIMFKNGEIIKDDETYKVLNDEKFLIENNLKATQLLTFVNKLKARGINLGKITNINELADAINKKLKNNKE
ncbi:energy-coupling factor transporter ATPase [Mycoplasma zalophi]|uniref:Energy-coupling factor transporter ATP-binding protein EcfA2 n=1 Tax=Mycoplasma zalophi TaxID=191287 RepID=A0ABS6DQC2_9MOLU|nr:energy-coupling factor transporter ATPase [Mycoplasma zalophi]MBU4690810.1 energy-coupling factor transporter ATPase [Mycoplasma zalophi]MBU4692376.1 energy-coupling factor transporter ATPase [Mycoplasma zalophi]